MRKHSKKEQRKRRWQKIVICLAAIVVFCTTYALILPAVAMENEKQVLDCPLSLHQHTSDCYGDDGALICGQEDFVIHVHNEACEDEDGNLVCQLPQIEAHEHTEECYVSQEVLICDQEESEDGHTHTSDCFSTEKMLICSDTNVLHRHSESCYDSDGNLICGQMEVLEHQHESACFRQAETLQDEVVFLAEGESDDGSGDSSGGVDADILIRLLKYAADTDGADATITIMKSNGEELTPNGDGSYDVVQSETYTVRVTFNSQDQVEPGRYYVTFPSDHELLKDQGGKLQLKDNGGNETDVGDWYFSQEDGQEGWLIFDLSEAITSFNNITIFADVEFKFDSVQDDLDFDGFIKVNVKPTDEVTDTEISKWARRNVEGADPDKIYWEVEIDGNSNSHIVGSTFTDTIMTTGTHHYTESDMTAGIAIEAYYYGNASTSATPTEEHKWIVYPGEKDFTWSETGWSYTVPDTVHCVWCNGDFTPGGDGWLYYLKYTSTVLEDGSGGYVTYENKVTFDGDEATGKTHAGEVGSTAQVVKTGSYYSTDESSYEDDTVRWTITATIPGAKDGHKYDYFWHLWDGMSLRQGSKDEGYTNDLNNPTVTAVVGGKRYSVPEKAQATENDLFYWVCSYSEESVKGNGIWSGREIDLYSRCRCTEATCPDWEDGKCAHESNGFCRCWCFTEEVTLTFTYETAANELVKKYGGLDASLYNYVELDNQQRDSNEKWQNVRIDHDNAEVPIPGIFTKQRTDEPDEDNGYLVEYTITANEAMADLSSNDTIDIVDTMSETLVFMQDTLVVTRTDAQGTSTILIRDDDYTVKYEPQTNVATITLLEKALGPYCYTLTYDAGISIAAGSANTSYSNEASIELFGTTYDTEPVPYGAPQAVISGETYLARLYKCDSTDQEKQLQGAVFALFTANGTKLGEYTTDELGIATIETDTSKGISLHSHTLYYLQEIEAPYGYERDPEEKYYFWFCNNNQLEGDAPCSQSKTLTKDLPDGAKATCIYTFRTVPDEQKPKDIIVSNAPIGNGGYELPNTGGPGTLLYMIGGVTVMTGTLTYYIYKRRRRG